MPRRCVVSSARTTGRARRRRAEDGPKAALRAGMRGAARGGGEGLGQGCVCVWGDFLSLATTGST